MRSRLVAALLIGLVVLLIALGIVWLLNRNRVLPSAQTAPPTADLRKPAAIAQTFQGCPPSGDGGDPVLNTLKNRIDEGQWQPLSFESILNLGWPKEIEYQPRSRWSRADAAEVAKHEGTPVQVEGYLLRYKKMSPESCNCHSVEQRDYHIWLGNSPNDGRERSVVIETTPRVTVYHPNWTSKRFGELVSGDEKVRISGWLLMDPEHPDQIGKTRGTIWEIHPVMQIEVWSVLGWRALDDGTTGISSAPAVAETAPAVTPVSTATTPPEGDPDVQDNTAVKIVTVNYDGSKGSNEPDEYVEITNEGTEPVDMTDWTLQDDRRRNFFQWESHVLEPGATIRVYTNEAHPDSGGFSFGAGRAIWGNSGDVAELYDADKVLVSRYAYGDKK